MKRVIRFLEESPEAAIILIALAIVAINVAVSFFGHAGWSLGWGANGRGIVK